ncbi:permease [Alicyclobacillus suci]|uniref:permease n=1 Tax=Alicyclobacillus suci TaxID=2816080 RepID=UPI001A8D9E45|nr:permease [Alicyclobacillus suci]
MRFGNTAWVLFKDLWYWAIVGTVLAQVVTRFIPFDKMQTTANGGNIRSVGIATVAGAGLPLCACGVIPFLVSFLRVGAPLAVIMAFTAASPLMDPADFAVTAGMLGLNWAIVKTVAALAMGAFVGLTILYQNRRGVWLNQVKVRVADSASAETVVTTTAEPSWIVASVKFLKDLWFSGKFLLLAIVLGALLNTLVPASVVTKVLGGHHWYSIPLGSLVGIATYGISDAPIIKVLLGLGMSKGAGMSFLIAGHATSIGLLTTLHTLVRRPLFVFYLVATLLVSLIFGIVFQVL